MFKELLCATILSLLVLLTFYPEPYGVWFGKTIKAAITEIKK